MEDSDYPGVLARVKAVVIDGIILVLSAAIISGILDQFSEVPDYIRIALFILVFLLYDPILTSSIGGTIGHRLIGLRVKKESDEKSNIIFPVALIRFILKSSLGWVSLISVMGNKKRLAIHDYAASSIVIFKLK